jgi:hypothetical protein
MRYLILITFIISYFNSFSQVTATITSFTDASCGGACDGTATVSVTGGTPPYSFSWSSGLTTQNATGLCPGTHTITVTDALAIVDTAVVTITQLSLLTVSVTVTDDTCGTCNATANAIVTGGTPPYIYTWSTTIATTQSVSGLCAGYQDLVVFDSGSCFGTGGHTVSLIGTPSCPQFQLGTINGTVYNDLNADCIQDTLESGLANVMIEANPGPYYSTTDANGNYSFNIPYGSYTITQISQQYYNEICPIASSYSLVIDSLNNTVNNIDFADTIVSVQDVSISLMPGILVPGFLTNYYLSYTSFSATPMNGSIYLVVHDSLSFSSSSVSPSQISGDTIFWNYTNLQQFETRWITVEFQMPPNVNMLGDTLEACTQITPITGDVNPSNNTDCDNSMVVGSYDPNDKRVVPQGSGPTGDILLSQTELLYKIRFQNSGTLYATNVVVIDTLSPNLDISSLRNVVATHPFTYAVTGQGELTFTFDNIMLPDSNVDEPGSHGAIQFTINQNTSNTIGTVIENTAHIYFDFNPAIVTNTVINTIATFTSIEETVNGIPLVKIYPNPTSTQLFIETTLKWDKIKLLDISGKVLKTVLPITGSIHIDVDDLSNGIYLIQLIGKDRILTQKFVKKE